MLVVVLVFRVTILCSSPFKRASRQDLLSSKVQGVAIFHSHEVSTLKKLFSKHSQPNESPSKEVDGEGVRDCVGVDADGEVVGD